MISVRLQVVTVMDTRPDPPNGSPRPRLQPDDKVVVVLKGEVTIQIAVRAEDQPRVGDEWEWTGHPAPELGRRIGAAAQ